MSPEAIARIIDAAREYVAARDANEAASVDNWSTALARVDAAYCELRASLGFPA